MPKLRKGPPPAVIDAVAAIQRGLNQVQRNLAPPQFALMDIVSSKWRPHALGVIARLGIADLLAKGPRPVSELARETRTHEDSLYRVLRALARDGILAEPSPRTFGLTSVSEPLRADHPATMRDTVIQMTSSWNSSAWAGLEETVRTGEPAFKRIHGKNLWNWFEEHPEEAVHFHRSMRELTRDFLPALLAAYDFGRFGSLVDVGGGGAQLLAGILAATPGLRGVNYDFERSMKEAPETLRAAGVADRVELVTGSYFEKVPAGHDAYLLKNIFHGHDDAELTGGFENLRAAMKPGAKLLVVEMLVPDDDWRTHPAFLDLQMLVGSGGRERTRGEFERLYARNGFRLTEVVRTASPFAIFVGETT